MSPSSFARKTGHYIRPKVRKIASTSSPTYSVRSISFLSSVPAFPAHPESSPSHRSQFEHLLKSALEGDDGERPRDKPTRKGRQTEGAKEGIAQLLRRETVSKEPDIEYDPARTYAARTLYESYKDTVQLIASSGQAFEPLTAASEPADEVILPDRIDAALVLPLLRAYSRSFIPDLPRAFRLYADVLESGTIGAPSTQAADVQMYAILLELCIRHRLFARALRLIRDMTLFGIEQLFRTGSSKALTANIDEDDRPESSRNPKLPILYVTPRDRLDLMTTLMQSAGSYAEAYGMYWRLRRIWTGIHAEAIHRRLRGPSPHHVNHGSETGGGFVHWIKRIASRSDAYTYLGEGIGYAGMPDTSKEALAYWSRDVPEVLDEETMANESVLLTEEELLADDHQFQAEDFQSSRFNLTSILGRLQTRRNATAAAAALKAKMTIYATPEERAARLSASPFNGQDWKYILSTFLNLPCGQVLAYQPTQSVSVFNRRPSKQPITTPTATSKEQTWMPAPPELVTSIFWDMLQAGVSPPSQVYTELLHYYTRLLKAPRKRNSALDIQARNHIHGDNAYGRRERELNRIEDRQRHFLASEAIASIHKLIYLDVNLEPDLPLINALMNAYGHLGQLDQVVPIWQSLVNLSGGGRPSLDFHKKAEDQVVSGKPSALVQNRMDAQSVSIVLDACAFASLPGALARARKVVGWARHRDRLVLSQARRDSAERPGKEKATVLMSKGAWDTWLECLCRRGQLREAIQVLKEEMIPILAEQRDLFHEINSSASSVSEHGHRVTGYEPDAKTLGTLLRFAARERDATGSSRSETGGARASGSNLQVQEEGSDADVVGGSFLGSALSASGSAQGSRNAPTHPQRRREASLYSELQFWIRKEYPHVWDEVKEIGLIK